jgi:hypothetical protein
MKGTPGQLLNTAMTSTGLSFRKTTGKGCRMN